MSTELIAKAGTLRVALFNPTLFAADHVTYTQDFSIHHQAYGWAQQINGRNDEVIARVYNERGELVADENTVTERQAQLG